MVSVVSTLDITVKHFHKFIRRYGVFDIWLQLQHREALRHPRNRQDVRRDYLHNAGKYSHQQ